MIEIGLYTENIQNNLQFRILTFQVAQEPLDGLGALEPQEPLVPLEDLEPLGALEPLDSLDHLLLVRSCVKR